MIRTLLAANPSAMTLDGTRTHIVGRRHLAIIDPGPSTRSHIDAIVDALGGPENGVAFHAVILLTHGHPDHAAGAAALADRLGAEIRSVARGNLVEGDTVETDSGDLTTLVTPGHTPDHASFRHARSETVFCGDLMMGGLDTALVAPPEGNLREYLASLERIRALRPDRIIPAHGPPIDDADAAIDRYLEHRRTRCAQVADALANAPPLGTRAVADRVYGGEVPEDLREVAVAAVVAYLEYLEEDGTVERADGLWRWTG
jgi:glyoxylase-like metal-dependent hydrolase (beta-lactamase superfamily II)